MSSNIKVIRFTTIMSAIFAALTYFISLNISYEWFDIAWLSNSFLLTIFGGAFASMLVVLICEIQKYLLLKREAENQIFYYAGHIWGKLKTIQCDLEKQIQDENIEADDHFTKRILEIHNLISTLQNIEYTSFCKNNKMQYLFNSLCLWLTREVFFIIDDGYCYRIAMNQDKINNLKTIGIEGKITANSPYTKKVLNIFYPKLLAILDEMDKYMYKIDELCGKRYIWDLRKTSILKSFDDMTEDVFEEYLKQGETL